MTAYEMVDSEGRWSVVDLPSGAKRRVLIEPSQPYLDALPKVDDARAREYEAKLQAELREIAKQSLAARGVVEPK